MKDPFVAGQFLCKSYALLYFPVPCGWSDLEVKHKKKKKKKSNHFKCKEFSVHRLYSLSVTISCGMVKRDSFLSESASPLSIFLACYARELYPIEEFRKASFLIKAG